MNEALALACLLSGIELGCRLQPTTPSIRCRLQDRPPLSNWGGPRIRCETGYVEHRVERPGSWHGLRPVDRRHRHARWCAQPVPRLHSRAGEQLHHRGEDQRRTDHRHVQRPGEGAAFDIAGVPFQITYAGGTGNDVVLTCVQVPASNISSIRPSMKTMAIVPVAVFLANTFEVHCRRTGHPDASV